MLHREAVATRPLIQRVALGALYSTAGALGLALISPWAIPIGPVPVTLGVLGVLLLGATLGPWLAAVAAVEYLLLGLSGVPCFARFTFGPLTFFGPTGGYLMAYPVAALASGWLYARLTSTHYGLRLAGALLAGLAGVAVIYAGGIAWLVLGLHTEWSLAIVIGLAPFILVDLAKSAAVAAATALKK